MEVGLDLKFSLSFWVRIFPSAVRVTRERLSFWSTMTARVGFEPDCNLPTARTSGEVASRLGLTSVTLDWKFEPGVAGCAGAIESEPPPGAGAGVATGAGVEGAGAGVEPRCPSPLIRHSRSSSAGTATAPIIARNQT